MTKKKINNERFLGALKAIAEETTHVRHNSSTIQIKGFMGPEVEIIMDFDDGEHLQKKLVNMFNTRAFCELLALHCEGEIMGGIDISIGTNMPSWPVSIK